MVSGTDKLSPVVWQQLRQPNRTRPLGATLLEYTWGIGEFEELCWHFMHQLPAPFQLGKITTRTDTDVGTHGTIRYEFDSRLYIPTPHDPAKLMAVGQIMLTLYRKPAGNDEDIFLELDHCQLWYPHLRGQGLGRAILHQVVLLGNALNAKAITAVAIYDGRFVWGALGFKFGDYLPQESSAAKYRAAFKRYCLRYGVTPPDVSQWDAPDFARFSNHLQPNALVGHSADRVRKPVAFGRAFLLSRRPMCLTLPLS